MTTDPLAEALVRACDLGPLCLGPRAHKEQIAKVRAALDALGYEVRPKLTVERLARALTPHFQTWPPPCTAREVARDQRDMQALAAAILAAMEANDE